MPPPSHLPTGFRLILLLKLLAAIVVRPRLDGASCGAPHAQQIADRWHLLHNLSEALEKVLARHHADLKRLFLPGEEPQVIAALDQEAFTHASARSQAEQQLQARREQRLATFTRVQELSAQGWSGASIARQLGIHKKTAVKYAAAERFPESRNDRDRKLAPYQPFLHTQWVAGEHNIAHLYQTICAASDIVVRKPPYVTISPCCARKSAPQDDRDAIIHRSLKSKIQSLAEQFQVVKRPG
jgi:hypothetical protein